MNTLFRRFFRALLGLYPKSVRDRFGRDMEECFADLLETERARRGRGRWLTVALRSVAELPWQALRARLAIRREERLRR